MARDNASRRESRTDRFVLDQPIGQARRHDPPARVRTLPSWLLAQAAWRSHLLVLHKLGTVGLRRHHYVLLTTLVEFGPATQADLGRRLGLDRSDMVAVVNDLEGRGLVTRNADPMDRRHKIVALTLAGVAMQGRLDALVHEANEMLLAPLSAEERIRFTDFVSRLAGQPAGPAWGSSGETEPST
ncbi:MAG: MarR family winged helix-turn-helix transcriptional regulator [Dehalococcoidia bacterium]